MSDTHALVGFLSIVMMFMCPLAFRMSRQAHHAGETGKMRQYFLFAMGLFLFGAGLFLMTFWSSLHVWRAIGKALEVIGAGTIMCGYVFYFYNPKRDTIAGPQSSKSQKSNPKR
jgi:divalent metal cation (Fe/Co/Zn/Cd) transporter